MYFPGMQRLEQWGEGDQTRKLNQVCQTASAPSSPEQAALHVHIPVLTLVLQMAVGDSTAGCCKSSCCLQLCTPASSRDPEEMCSNCAELTTDWCRRSAALLAPPAKATGCRQRRKHPGPSCGQVLSVSVALFLEGHSKQALSLGGGSVRKHHAEMGKGMVWRKLVRSSNNVTVSSLIKETQKSGLV